MENILNFFKTRVEEANWLGIGLLAVAAVLVYGAQPIIAAFIKQEEKRKNATAILKVFGLVVAIFSMLLLMEII